MPIPSSLIRRFVGIGLLGLAGWGLFKTYLSPESKYAVLTRDAAVIRSPIAGTITLLGGSAARPISKGEVLGVVEDLTVDMTTLARMRADVESLQAETQATERLLEGMTLHASVARSKDGASRRLHLHHLKQLLVQAQAERESGELEAERTSQERARAEALSKSGLLSTQGLLTASQGAASATVRLRASDAKARDVQNMIEAATKLGAFDSVAGSGTLYNRGRADDLQLAVENRRADLAGKSALLGTLKAELDQEQRRVARLQKAQLASDKPARVWRVLAREGEFVMRGQPVMELATCSNAYVVASVLPRYVNSAAPGTRATFRLSNSRREYGGQVVQTLAGEVPDTLPRVQSQVSVLSAKGDPVHFVLVQLDPNPELSRSCEIGLVGEVQFHAGRKL